jgi:hypothetical protein
MSFLYPSDRRLDGAKAEFDAVEEEKNFFMFK